MSYCRFKEQDLEEYDLLGPLHPGEILREVLFPRLKMSRKALARDMGISYTTLCRLLKERSRVSPGIAMELARISGTNILYWLVVQAHHDAWRAEKKREERQRLRTATAELFERPARPRISLLDASLAD